MTILQVYFSQISNELIQWLKIKRDLWIFTFKILIVISLSFTCAFPYKFWTLIMWNNAIIIWFINFYFIVFYLYPFVKSQYLKDFSEVKEELLFFWISLDKIVDYIIKTQSFKLYEVSKEFCISTKTVSDMMNKINETPIFKRWKNNERILDITLKKSDIIYYLTEIEEEDNSWFCRRPI